MLGRALNMPLYIIALDEYLSEIIDITIYVFWRSVQEMFLEY